NANDYEAGKRKAFICAECHGERGISVLGIYPNLSGQKYEYLVSVLFAYKNGLRVNEIMQAMVINLTEQDIHNLAVYFSQQNCNN
ncbi:MAG: c-type cytochrome, partial [Gammaproteobacteria bacterium]|nr:c-type cytochrome [Gammaproteobacteria bacterium]